jgi:hypothetical protein
MSVYAAATAPARPTVRWHRRIEVCSKCGREAVVKRCVCDELVREFIANGLCFNCSRASL